MNFNANFAKQLYCTPNDVTNLLSNIDGYVSTLPITTTAINNATNYVDFNTNRTFAPTRKIVELDFDYNHSFVLNSPIISINSITIGSTLLYDSDVQIDRNSGLVILPTSNFTNFNTNFSQYFQPKIIVDYISGSSDVSFDEVLTTTNNLTFNFAQKGVQYTIPGSTNSYPIISVDGVVVSSASYVVNTSSNGDTGITFSQPISSSSIVTATYPFWSLDPLIVSATAKLSAIEILTQLSLTSGYSSAQFQGVSVIQADSSSIQFGNGQFSKQIAQYKKEVDEILKGYRRMSLG